MRRRWAPGVAGCAWVVAAQSASAEDVSIYPPKRSLDEYRSDPAWRSRTTVFVVDCDKGAREPPRRRPFIPSASTAFATTRLLARADKLDKGRSFASALKSLSLRPVGRSAPPEDPGTYNVVAEQRLCLFESQLEFGGYRIHYTEFVEIRVLDPPASKTFGSQTMLSVLHAAQGPKEHEIDLAARDLMKARQLTTQKIVKWLKPIVRRGR